MKKLCLVTISVLIALGVLVWHFVEQSSHDVVKAGGTERRDPMNAELPMRDAEPGRMSSPDNPTADSSRAPADCQSEWNSIVDLPDVGEWGIATREAVDSKRLWEASLIQDTAIGRCTSLAEAHPLFCAQLQFSQACGPLLSQKGAKPYRGRYLMRRAMSGCARGSTALLSGLLEPAVDPEPSGPFTAKSPKLLSAECYTQAHQYRMDILSHRSQGVPISKTVDPRVLMARYLSAISIGEKGTTIAREIARRAVEIRPRDQLAARMWAFAENRRTTEKSRDKDGAWGEARLHLEQIAPDDPYLLEMTLEHHRQQNSTHELRRVATQSLKQHKSLSAYYYLAWSAYLEKDRQLASRLLAEAQKAWPRDSRIRYSTQVFAHGMVDVSGIAPFISLANDTQFAFSQ